MNKVTIIVSGRVGSGKSAICGEIEILCRALGLKVEWTGGQEEKNLTHADWTEALEIYRPEVVIVEQIERASPQPPAQADARVGLTDEEITEIGIESGLIIEYGRNTNVTVRATTKDALRFARALLAARTGASS